MLLIGGSSSAETLKIQQRRVERGPREWAIGRGRRSGRGELRIGLLVARGARRNKSTSRPPQRPTRKQRKASEFGVDAASARAALVKASAGTCSAHLPLPPLVANLQSVQCTENHSRPNHRQRRASLPSSAGACWAHLLLRPPVANPQSVQCESKKHSRRNPHQRRAATTSAGGALAASSSRRCERTACEAASVCSAGELSQT